MKNGPVSSPILDNEHDFHGPDNTTSPLGARSCRPFAKLTNIMSTLESGKNKLQHGTKALSRSMSQISRFSDLSVFDTPNSRMRDLVDGEGESTDEDTGNDTTLNDDDFLCSPLYKNRGERKVPQQEPPQDFHIRRTQSCLQDPELADRFDGSELLPLTRLQTFKVSQDLLPRIDEHEMHKIVSGQYDSEFDDYIVIDCRFPYEFDGGHIVNAINISSKNDLEMRFINHRLLESRKRLLIFHCEYSIFRGPTMAGHLRKADRIFNSDNYPRLLYPDIVVLEGGYKKFFDSHKEWCVPQAYVEMKDIKHKRACEVEMSKVIQASKLTRARSFNQFQLHSSSHSRSSSFTALLTSTEQNLTSPGLPTSLSTSQVPRRKAASKVHKRQDRRELRLHLSQPQINWPSHLSESPTTSDFPYGSSSCFDDDAFAPPSALFREHSKNLSILLGSIHSSALLVCSENYSSAFTSTESLASCSSPSADSPEFFDSTTSNEPQPPNLSLSNATHMFASPLNSPYLFPVTGSNSGKPKRPSLQRPVYRTPRPYVNMSSPTTSSPLTTTTPGSVFDSWPPISHSDAINDTPLSFSLKQSTPENSVFNKLSSRVQPESEINEEDEEFA